MVSNENLQGFYWNPGTGEIDLRAFEGASTIINLAGASISKRWSRRYKAEIRSSRLNALKTLHGALKKVDRNGIISFVSASAIGIYPDSLTAYYEEDAKGIDKSFLGEVVHAWENEVNPFDEFGFSVSKIRIGLVMSTKGGALPEMTRPIRYFAGAAFGSGEQWQSWIHISDLARMFLFVAENRLQGIYNGVGPNPVTNNKLVKEVARALKKPLFLPNIPRVVMKAALGEMSYILFSSQRAGSKKIEEEGFIFNYRNVSTALEDLYRNSARSNTADPAYNKEYIS